MNKRRIVFVLSLALMLILLTSAVCFAADGEDYVSPVYQTIWSLLPPVVAITLALITKEVFSSLFVGVVIGAVLYNPTSFSGTITHLVSDGFLVAITDSWNMGIIMFLVILGILVALMNNSGGSRAFGKWAIKHIKSKRGAALATIFLGMLIFIDDYFNCLTVGSVMTPVCNEAGISKTKLAYLIDATAAPICILAPISSWAAAVSGFVENENGIKVFIEAIPYNFYAILTLVMIFTLVIADFDFATMRKYANELVEKEEAEAPIHTDTRREGKVYDLIIPIIILIIACVIGMIYTGGYFEGETFVNSFANSDAATGLAMGSIVALVIIVIYYLCRGTITFKVSMECIPEGFKAMVSPILILTLAWTLKNMTDVLGLAEFVAGGTANVADNFISLLPALVFVIAAFLGFSSGTSWGTFGILIPVVVAVFQGMDHTMLIMAMSAVMAGGVCGDHCSPISDTTIMASAGAKCNHVLHVQTQLPYALTVVAVSFVTYIIAGFVKTAWIALPAGIVLMVGTLLVIKATQKPLPESDASAAN